MGLTMALLLAGQRLRVALVAPATTAAKDHPDIRCYALSLASRQLLASLRAWPEGDAVTPVLRMAVSGDAGGQVAFDAAEQGVEALAWIVDAAALQARLTEALSFQPLVETLAEAPPAALTVICEGQASSSREALGIDFETLPYHQVALATRLRCEKPHLQTARQWFAGGEVLALLPIGGAQGNSVALVWSIHADRQQQVQSMDNHELAQALTLASQHALGSMEVAGPRGMWPLQQARATRWCGPMPAPAQGAWALAGDAAHQVHPLAGQGLNLGLGDAAELARVLGGREYWRGVDDLKLLRRYERARKLAIGPIGMAMDGLQRLFQPQQEPWSGLRNAGMNGFDRLRPLKSWVVARAMQSA